MIILNDLAKIVEYNNKRDKILKNISSKRRFSMYGCDFNNAYIIDGCIEKENVLYSKEGNKLGIKIKDTYYILQKENRPFGVMYFATENIGKFIGIPFIRD